MAGAAQFALDANHAPGPVLPRQAHGQGGQLLAGWRAARRLAAQRPRAGRHVITRVMRRKANRRHMIGDRDGQAAG
jgi:hypothetical protein